MQVCNYWFALFYVTPEIRYMMIYQIMSTLDGLATCTNQLSKPQYLEPKMLNMYSTSQPIRAMIHGFERLYGWLYAPFKRGGPDDPSWDLRQKQQRDDLSDFCWLKSSEIWR